MQKGFGFGAGTKLMVFNVIPGRQTSKQADRQPGKHGKSMKNNSYRLAPSQTVSTSRYVVGVP